MDIWVNLNILARVFVLEGDQADGVLSHRMMDLWICLSLPPPHAGQSVDESTIITRGRRSEDDAIQELREHVSAVAEAQLNPQSKRFYLTEL